MAFENLFSGDLGTLLNLNTTFQLVVQLGLNKVMSYIIPTHWEGRKDALCMMPHELDDCTSCIFAYQLLDQNIFYKQYLRSVWVLWVGGCAHANVCNLNISARICSLEMTREPLLLAYTQYTLYYIWIVLEYVHVWYSEGLL